MHASTLKTGTAAALALVAALAMAGCNKTADGPAAAPGSSSTSPSTGGAAMPPASGASGSGG